MLTFLHHEYSICYRISVAYPGFYKGGCLMICVQSARENFGDHAHHFGCYLWGVDSVKSTVTILEEGGFDWRGCFSVGGYHFCGGGVRFDLEEEV